MSEQFFSGIPPHVPVYQLLSACFLDDDTLHLEGEQIAYEGIPNEQMAPLNEPARAKMAELLAHLEECAREKARVMNKPYTGRITDLGDLIIEGRQFEQQKLEAKTRPMPVVPQTEVPIRPDMVPIATRRQKAKQTAVRAFGQTTRAGRPVAEPLHKLAQDKLTDKAPLEG